MKADGSRPSMIADFELEADGDCGINGVLA
jgi:hypothetical protein